MELRYCEVCGDIIKVQGEEDALSEERYICDRCAAKQENSESKPKEKAEDVGLQNMVPTASAQSGEKKTAAKADTKDPDTGEIIDELSLDNLLASKELDLFSAETVVRRQREQSSRQEMGTKTRIKLLDPEDPPAGEGSAGVRGGSSTGSAAAPVEKPAAQAKVPPPRLQFPCPGCKVTLSIKPVTKTTRLRCPKCRSRMVIDPDRNVSLIEVGSDVIKRVAHAPKTPSSAVRKGSAAVRTGSAAVRRGSAAVGVQESLIASKSADDLARLADGKVPPQPHPPSPQAAHEEDLAAYREALTGESPRKDTSAETAPDEMELPVSTQAPPAESPAAVALRAAFLGMTLAAPFFVWAVLLSLSESGTFDLYLQAFGEIVQETFDSVFGF